MNPKVIEEIIILSIPNNLSLVVDGVMSPYPIEVIVVNAQYSEFIYFIAIEESIRLALRSQELPLL